MAGRSETVSNHPSALSVRNLAFDLKPSKSESVTRLGPLSFDVQAGECLALIGRSGVGKTSLLHLVAGFYEPSRNTGGVIEIAGTRVFGSGINLPPHQRGIGFMFQRGAGLQEDHTVQSNISFPLTQAKFTSCEASDRSDQLADQFSLCRTDLDPKADTPPFLSDRVSALSGGEAQRVALARCFAREDRNLYLLDEPFLGQDNPLRHELVSNLRAQIKQSNRRRGSGRPVPGFLVVTHNQNDAFWLADRVLFLDKDDDGAAVLLAIDTPENLYLDPPHLSIATFLGAPAINRSLQTVSESGIILGGLTISPVGPGTHDRVWVCFRAESIVMQPPEEPAAEFDAIVREVVFISGARIVSLEISEIPELTRLVLPTTDCKIEVDQKEKVWIRGSGIYIFDHKTRERIHCEVHK